MRHLCTVTILLAIWCVLSGKFDALHLGVGVVTVLLITVGIRLRRPRPLPLWRLVVYLPWLGLQIVKSNIHVAWLVLLRPEQVKPRFVRITPGLEGDHPITLLGCSITLTPGTVTVDTNGKWLLVHALDDSSAADLESGEMAGRVAKVYGRRGGDG
jgi:multicomponent Na+:H+ antiporter subunit E